MGELHKHAHIIPEAVEFQWEMTFTKSQLLLGFRKDMDMCRNNRTGSHMLQVVRYVDLHTANIT